MDQGIASIISTSITAVSALVGIIIGATGTYFFTDRADKKKQVRSSIEEIFLLSNQIRIWFYVTIRHMHKIIDNTDYYRVHIPAEYLEDDNKEPDCPIDRFKMLVVLDVPSLKKHLPEYVFIVSQLRETKYIFDKHQSVSTLNYYISGVVYDELEKMSGKVMETIGDFFSYAEPAFEKRCLEIEEALSKSAQKN